MRLKTTIIIVLKVETVAGPKAEESGERGQPAPAAPACLVCWGLGPNLSILKPRRGPGQGDGPRRSENIGRRIAIRRSEIDRDVNFAKKNPELY